MSEELAAEVSQNSVQPRYRMTISRLTIDKLGIKMYDRVVAVLAELIANSYDADATRVTIRLPWGSWLADSSGLSRVDSIEIADNGHGMTSDEVNRHYLQVGSDRRSRFGSDRSRGRNRPVMGRKGIGKLAPFGICRQIEVWSAGGPLTENGYEVSHLTLKLDEILSDTDSEYNPESGEDDGTWADATGTKIILRDFLRKRVPDQDELHRQLAARFGVQRSDWVVNVRNSATDVQEDAVLLSLGPQRDSFVLGELQIDLMPNTRIELDSWQPIRYDGEEYRVRGWVAYAKAPYKDDAMAGVRVYARGKLVTQTRDFAIGSGFHGEWRLRSYLVGEIHAEWLDQQEDLVRSDRQDIIWSSGLGEAFQEWGRGLLRELAKINEANVKRESWERFMGTGKLDAALQSTQSSDGYNDAITRAARALIEETDPAQAGDANNAEKVVELAVSIAPHRELLESLQEVASSQTSTLQRIVDLFARARVGEMYSLGQVAQERLNALTRLRLMVEEGGTLEDPLQRLVEEAPWILAPEWTPLGMNESLKRVRANFESWYLKINGTELVTSAISRQRKEPDFVMLHDSGFLWVVEIKRMDYELTNPEFERGLGYLESLESFLNENPEIGKQFPGRRLTFVVGGVSKLTGAAKSSLSSDPRIDWRTWMGLLDSTQRAHKDFLDRVDAMKRGSDLD